MPGAQRLPTPAASTSRVRKNLFTYEESFRTLLGRNIVRSGHGLSL